VSEFPPFERKSPTARDKIEGLREVGPDADDGGTVWGDCEEAVMAIFFGKL
jgi:hypothetical protein